MLNLEYLGDLILEHRSSAKAQVREFSISGLSFSFNSSPSIMGVINLSAGSWYRESVCLSADQAIQRGQVLKAQGAAIVDVGAESTLAHTARADEDMQSTLLLPVVKGLKESGVLVSVETYLPQVARKCLEAGADVLNLTGTTQTDEIYRMAADHDAGVIICYVQGANVREVGNFDLAADPIPMLYDYFAREIEKAERNGAQKLFIDPGLGFYYRNLQDSSIRVEHQMKTFLNTFRLRKLGYPTCHALPHAFEFFAEEVRCAEPFFCVLAALGKTDLFRTHEVPRIKAVLKTLSVIGNR